MSVLDMSMLPCNLRVSIKIDDWIVDHGGRIFDEGVVIVLNYLQEITRH